MRNQNRLLSTMLLTLLMGSLPNGAFAASTASGITAMRAAAAAAGQPDPITMGLPGYGGSGCPAGTVSATLSPDSTQLSLLFDGFVVNAGGTARSTDVKSCQIAIPLTIPHGYSIAVAKVDYRGFNSIPAGGLAEFTAEYFFPGQAGKSYIKRFYGAQDSDYLITNRLGIESLVWSPCGMATNLRTRARMMAKTNSMNDSVTATVDSIDISAGVVYQIQWRRCDGASGDLGGLAL